MVGAVKGLAVQQGRAGDNQGSAGFVNEGLVGFVKDEGVQIALHLRRRVGFQVVAQQVKAELAQVAIDNMLPVGVAAFRGEHRSQHIINAEAEGTVHRGQEFAVPGRQIVVGGGDMDGAAVEGVQDGGKGGGNRLALAGIHFHNFAAEQVDSGQKLLVGGVELQADMGIPAGQGLVKLGRQQKVPRIAQGQFPLYPAQGCSNKAFIGGQGGGGRVYRAAGGRGEILFPILPVKGGVKDAPVTQAAAEGFVGDGKGGY